MDITWEWTKNKGIKGSVAERQEYTVSGVTYKVDDRYVILHPTEQEKVVLMKGMEVLKVYGRK